MARPGIIGRREYGAIGSDFDPGKSRLGCGDQAGDVIALLDWSVPVGILVAIEFSQMIAKNVGELAAPAMPAIVGVQSVAKSLVSGFLHGYVESGVNAQALLVNGVGSVSLLEILANILDE